MNLFASIENVHVHSLENLRNIHVYLTEKLVYIPRSIYSLILKVI
jgi:hypothetical protein